jgi:hypothetical protein
MHGEATKMLSAVYETAEYAVYLYPLKGERYEVVNRTTNFSEVCESLDHALLYADLLEEAF